MSVKKRRRINLIGESVKYQTGVANGRPILYRDVVLQDVEIIREDEDSYYPDTIEFTFEDNIDGEMFVLNDLYRMIDDLECICGDDFDGIHKRKINFLLFFNTEEQVINWFCTSHIFDDEIYEYEFDWDAFDKNFKYEEEE